MLRSENDVLTDILQSCSRTKVFADGSVWTSYVMLNQFFFQGTQRHFKLQIAHWVFNRSILQFCYFYALNQISTLMNPVLCFLYKQANSRFFNWFMCYCHRNPVLLFLPKWRYQNWLCIICCQFNNILILSVDATPSQYKSITLFFFNH